MILETWEKLSRLPAGNTLFSAFLRFYVPYTGSIRPKVLELRPGYARVEVADRRRVRNHLQSVHAVAQMNLAEAASGLALNAGVPKGSRAILVSFQIEFLKKARGTLVAQCDCPIPPPDTKQEYQVEAFVRDESGDVVSKATARWLVGPKRKS